MTVKMDRSDDGEKRVTSATVVGLKYVVEIKGLTREMLNDFYVKAGMKDGSLKKRFCNLTDSTTYIFTVHDTEKELLQDTTYRLQATDNFNEVFDISEVDGQYEVTVKKNAPDEVSSEIAETVQSLLCLATIVVDEWRLDMKQDRGGTVGISRSKPSQKKKTKTQRRKKWKYPQPLEEFAKTLSLPEGECEGNNWVLAENIGSPQTNSLRTKRSEGQKYKLEDESIFDKSICGSVLGRDPQGRIWWQPEENSKKVFYLRDSLTSPPNGKKRRLSKKSK